MFSTNKKMDVPMYKIPSRYTMILSCLSSILNQLSQKTIRKDFDLGNSYIRSHILNKLETKQYIEQTFTQVNSYMHSWSLDFDDWLLTDTIESSPKDI
jgi:hypothetical protein